MGAVADGLHYYHSMLRDRPSFRGRYWTQPVASLPGGLAQGEGPFVVLLKFFLHRNHKISINWSKCSGHELLTMLDPWTETTIGLEPI